MTTDNNQIKSWILPKPVHKNELFNCQINYILQKVMTRRGFNLEEELEEFLTPSELPHPESHFKELNKATQRIIDSCAKKEKIAICGDYDADGITSTVLLVELLSGLGAKAVSYIPSRQEEGYGLNLRMVKDIYENDIKLVITVDNGISAFDAIKRLNELKIDLIITDHHKIPQVKLDIFSLIHPENTPKNSPYKYLAGVGIALLLAKNICKKLNYNLENTSANVLFCIGTIADMAPLVGANRKWLKEYLPNINSTNNIGIKTIIKKLGIDEINILSEHIGFKIAPLINAVGRIGDPKLVIDLLTNTSEDSIIKIANECFAISKERKRITALAEAEALKIANDEYAHNRMFLVISKEEWHPGIIGIVAARIADKFNLPTAILSVGSNGIFRGSIRSNNLIKVNSALNECSDLLLAHGGHSSAAGFTIKEENIPKLKEKLNNIAIREFENLNLKKSIKPEAYLHFKDITYDFYRQLFLMGPFGIMNKEPIFWTRKCRVIDFQPLKGNHLKLILDDGTGIIEGIKWNFFSQINKNDLIDIAYNVQINNWKKKRNIQLNIIDIKKYSKIVELKLHQSIYKCQLTENKKIKITNLNGQLISSEINIRASKENVKKEIFSKKILSFAEIALGKTA